MDKGVIGIICTRSGSRRLKGKNGLTINGQSLARRAAGELRKCIKDVVHLTDMEEFLSDPGSIKRPSWLNHGAVPLQDVVFWYLDGLEDKKKYDTVCLLMVTNPWITSHDIEKAITRYRETKSNILRSYNTLTGEENGLYIFDIDYVLANEYVYDVHTSMVIVPGIEIHTEKEYNIAKKTFES